MSDVLSTVPSAAKVHGWRVSLLTTVERSFGAATAILPQRPGIVGHVIIKANNLSFYSYSFFGGGGGGFSYLGIELVCGPSTFIGFAFGTALGTGLVSPFSLIIINI